MAGKPMLHQTDLFRPPIDPDDHWDLACVYALAAGGDVDLRGILLDYPPDRFPGRSPDVCGIAQLSYLTGTAVHLAVGSSVPFSPAGGRQALTRADRAGADFVLEFLRQAESPAIINIVGSCRDVALAALLDPDLFASNCAGIYLNAGNGCQDPALIQRREYNVTLNPEAYAAIFRVPCAVYWMPCYEANAGEEVVREFATWYRFRQDEILPSLSSRLRGYFTYSLEGRVDTRYLRYTLEPDSDSLSPYTIMNHRHMWCTAGFFHAAGYAVTRGGEIVPLAEAGERSVYEFCPVEVSCDENGDTRWRLDEGSRDRYIFRVRDTDAYPSAMTAAMRTLLARL